MLESIHVLGLERFFASLGNHAALHPHLDSVGHRQIGAFRDKAGGKLGIPSTENFVIEGLGRIESVRVHHKRRRQTTMVESYLPANRRLPVLADLF